MTRQGYQHSKWNVVLLLIHVCVFYWFPKLTNMKHREHMTKSTKSDIEKVKNYLWVDVYAEWTTEKCDGAIIINHGNYYCEMYDDGTGYLWILDRSSRQRSSRNRRSNTRHTVEADEVSCCAAIVYAHISPRHCDALKHRRPTYRCVDQCGRGLVHVWELRHSGSCNGAAKLEIAVLSRWWGRETRQNSTQPDERPLDQWQACRLCCAWNCSI